MSCVIMLIHFDWGSVINRQEVHQSNDEESGTVQYSTVRYDSLTSRVPDASSVRLAWRGNLLWMQPFQSIQFMISSRPIVRNVWNLGQDPVQDQMYISRLTVGNCCHFVYILVWIVSWNNRGQWREFQLENFINTRSSIPLAFLTQVKSVRRLRLELMKLMWCVSWPSSLSQWRSESKAGSHDRVKM